MRKIVIDHIKNIEVDLDNLPLNNLHAVDFSANGIIYLAQFVKNIEEKMKTTNKDTTLLISFSNPEVGLVACHFYWFAITIVNYVKSIALIDLMSQRGWKTKDIMGNSVELKKYCDDYVKEVIPEILEWRNKVAAHFAIIDPRKDSQGTLEFSLFNPVSFSAPHYYVGNFQWVVDGESSSLPKWSLVDIFENQLIPRYWPELKVK